MYDIRYPVSHLGMVDDQVLKLFGKIITIHAHDISVYPFIEPDGFMDLSPKSHYMVTKTSSLHKHHHSYDILITPSFPVHISL